MKTAASSSERNVSTSETTAALKPYRLQCSPADHDKRKSQYCAGVTTYENPCEIFEGGIFAPKFTERKVEKYMDKTTMSVQELSSQLGIFLPKAYELVKSEGFPFIR